MIFSLLCTSCPITLLPCYEVFFSFFFFFIITGMPTYNTPTFLEGIILFWVIWLSEKKIPTPFPVCRIYSKRGPFYFANVVHLKINKDCFLQFSLGWGGLNLNFLLCLSSIILIRELCHRWRHVLGKESICFHTNVISNKERWGSHVIRALDCVHIRSAFQL